MNEVLDKKPASEESLAAHELRIKRIVVAVDLSPHSESTASYAAGFAKAFGASITLVHIFGTQPTMTFNAYETSAEEKRHTSERKLVSLADKIREICPDCEIMFGVGDPAEEVSRIAVDLSADLIITASHHPAFLSRMLGLDQAPRILHRAPCPVLVYHEACS